MTKRIDAPRKSARERILGPEPTEEQKSRTRFEDFLGVLIVIPIVLLLKYFGVF